MMNFKWENEFEYNYIEEADILEIVSSPPVNRILHTLTFALPQTEEAIPIATLAGS